MKYRMTYYIKVIIAISMALFFTGCSQGYLLIEGERGGIAVQKQERRSDHRKGVGKIPPGHMPPPYTLSRNVPPGAWLIRG